MKPDEQYLTQAEELDEAREDEARHADPLRRCTHHTARVSGKPCPVSDCIIRNAAADRIEELERAAGDEVRGMVRAFEAEITELKAELERTSAEVEELTESLANVRGDLDYAIGIADDEDSPPLPRYRS